MVFFVRCVLLPLIASVVLVTGGCLASKKTSVHDVPDVKAISVIPRNSSSKTTFSTDHQFDTGSGIEAVHLTEIQISNLYLLGKVWGFLKYYHPAITAGERQWDFELIRILPDVLGAPSIEKARFVLGSWIVSLGTVEPCTSCANVSHGNIQHKPQLDWIRDIEWLGVDLSKQLQEVYAHRSATQQFYVSLNLDAGNPIFEHEFAYPAVRFPDAYFQLLSLFRFWNVVEYWYPYRDLLDDWDQVLQIYIPRIAQEKSSAEYQREFMTLIARLHDSHANLWSSLSKQPPVGACQLPINIRFIGGDAVVAGFSESSAHKAGLLIGDEILSIDDVSIADLINEYRPYYGSSNDGSLLRDIARSIGRGDCAEATVRVKRGSDVLAIKSSRLPISNLSLGETAKSNSSGVAFKFLSPQVAYLKASSIKAAEIEGDIKRSAHTQGLVIDLRGYPSEFIVFALGDLLIQKRAAFARFACADLANPGAFYWTPPVELTPRNPHYYGQVRILVDETTQSQAEYTALALRVAPNSKIVGSATAGADGNVSRLALPFGLWTLISGIGVFRSDNQPTQRIGIIPDIAVSPGIEGIRYGRDEILEAAIRSILGAKTSAREIARQSRSSDDKLHTPKQQK